MTPATSTRAASAEIEARLGKGRVMRAARPTTPIVPLPAMRDHVWRRGARVVEVGHAIACAFQALRPREDLDRADDLPVAA